MMLFSEFVLVNLMMCFLGESKALAKKTGITFIPPARWVVTTSALVEAEKSTKSAA